MPVTMHKDDWERLTADQKLDALRDDALGHEIWIRCLIQAVERLGVRFTTGTEPDDGVEDS